MELVKVVKAKTTLEGFAERDNINASLAYWMMKFVMEAQAEHDFYLSSMKKIIDKYAVEQDGDLIIPEVMVQNFREEVKELEHTDVVAPSVKLPLSDMARALQLSMKEIYPLMDFIDEAK